MYHAGVTTFCLFFITLHYPIQAAFDTSICNGTKAVPPPLPVLAPSYSTSVEWKLLHENSTVLGREFVDGIQQISSIDITKEGIKRKVIFDDHNGQYSVVDEKGCNTYSLVAQLVLLDNTLWYTTTRQLYDTMKATPLVALGASTIRNTRVDSWWSCMYIFQFEITVEMTMSFAVDGWPMPGVSPDAMVPVRVELRGTKNGTYFHVIGDYINFTPSPTFDQQNLQPAPGTFCTGKFPGKLMLTIPDSFNTVIELVDTHKKHVTFQTTWFDYQRKLVRYDTKSADGTDEDPKTIILDFYRGVRYEIDPYIGSCRQIAISRGDNFVDMSIAAPRVQMQNASSFFHTDTNSIQYVGKRFTRGVVCDVWVGVYYDFQSFRNQTIEWYFMEGNWIEAAGLSLTPGSLVRYDIWEADATDPMIYNVHKMDSTRPNLMNFDVGSCFNSTSKIHFVVKFSVSDGSLISEVSQSYLVDNIQESLSKSASIEPTRMSNIITERYGGPNLYLIAVLLDTVSVTNYYVFPPPPIPHSLEGAFDFITGTVYNPWTHNVTTRTGRNLLLVATGIIRINYPGELTTTTVASTTKGTFLVPTLPNVKSTTPLVPPSPGAVTTTTVPTPAPPGTTTQSRPQTTTHNQIATTKAVQTKKPSTRKPVITQPPAPCVCPKVTCPKTPVATTPKPAPPIICTTPTAPVVPTSTPNPYTSSTIQKSTTNQPSQGSTLGNTQSQPSTKGVSSGAVAGIAVAMVIVGFIMGGLLMKLFVIKYPKGLQYGTFSNPTFDSDMKY